MDIVSCGTINDTKTLLADLLSDYNINVRPVANQSQAVNVTVQAYIKSIQEFDEVQGKFSFIGAFSMMWHDVNMIWNPALYGGVQDVTLLYPNVWIPELILLSPSDDVDRLGQKWNRIRYLFQGEAVWIPIDLIESTCSVNIRNYPFDRQKCVTSFHCLGYNDYEVQLIAASDKFSLDVYQENSIWSIEKTKVTVFHSGAGSQIDLIIYLKRKPSFVIINVVTPILFLSLLNVLVFFLIPESGERVSYCITVLLAIAVFMTIVSDMLPRSSEPVPIISFKLMMDMIISSCIVFVAIQNLNWYYRDDSVPIPLWLKSAYKRLSCTCCCRRKVISNSIEMNRMNKKNNTRTIRVNDLENDPIEKKISRLVDEHIETEVTWKKLSQMMDWVALLCFTVASVLNYVIFLAIIAVGSSQV
ncbi:neuronal acetylcholine receptor subunit alpha-3-like [Mercenaria mercenaria]|uniref:neuronal acetylcholine receptor subunit alpha-3-like n=1 Tax=Mercenaria mercenaria TaxID=6596 RepID=UPI00234E91AC|nr:neuronal acetylcholine receptor subunit alpha-3-like [Mercenaria mercenaria]